MGFYGDCYRVGMAAVDAAVFCLSRVFAGGLPQDRLLILMFLFRILHLFLVVAVGTFVGDETCLGAGGFCHGNLLHKVCICYLGDSLGVDRAAVGAD